MTPNTTIFPIRTDYIRSAIISLSVLCTVTVLGLNDAAAGQSDKGPSPTSPKNDLEALTFTKLILRGEGRYDISVAPEEFRVSIIEELRKNGYNAYGAESLLFDRDESQRARFLLGGTMNELECSKRGRGTHIQTICDVAISWELFDRARDKIIYRVLTRARTTTKSSKIDGNQVVHVLVLGALKSLMRRPKFNAALKTEAEEPDQDGHPQGSYLKCDAKEVSLPKDMPKVLDASVVIKTETGVGSGFFISRDGLIITANHVIEGASKIEIRLHDETTTTATVLRQNRKHDVALLKAAKPNGHCLGLKNDPVNVGAALYTVGSPAGEDLAFSVSRGIVSGLRDWKGMKFVQTDAALNHGNSGGPMVDDKGKVFAIVSWKVPLAGFEGLAFGVPIPLAYDKLAITPGEATQISSTSGTQVAAQSETIYPVVDVPDLSVDEAEKRKEMARREERLKADEAARIAAQKREAEWQKANEEWEKEVAPIKKKRKPYLIAGTTLLISGVALGITGAVYLKQKKDYVDLADYYYDYWQSSTNPDDQAYYEDEIRDAENGRDLKNVGGIIFLSTGGVALVTSIILYIAMPNLPDRPSRSELSKSLEIQPMLGINNLGLSIVF